MGNVPIGKKLLEIGAGNPWVANMLADIGYDVTIIDPYDGRSHGPTEFAKFAKHFPKIKFLRDVFPTGCRSINALPYDCIYSISVLEHLQLNEIDEVICGMKMMTVPGGVTIHAIDNVLLENGAQWHRSSLERIGSHLEITPDQISSLLDKANNDPDTYFLSAEAHNLWRGSLPYEQFPMRRCISIQLVKTIGH